MRPFKKIMLISLLPYYQKKFSFIKSFIRRWLQWSYFGQNKIVAVIENLWYETQGPKRTYVPSSAFLSVTSLFHYSRKIFKDKINITYDEYKQMVIWRMKDMNSNLFKVRLLNLLAKSMAFNMSLEFSPSDVPDNEYAKISKVWEKSACGDPNHPQHLEKLHLFQNNL